jgi:hypothetical protein
VGLKFNPTTTTHRTPHTKEANQEACDTSQTNLGTAMRALGKIEEGETKRY